MKYADIILPLPLEGQFTYSIPQSLVGEVTFGVLVLVPFGRSKKHIGVVTRIHDDCPQGYNVKDIEHVMEAKPIITSEQYRLWQWIADYYMSPIGEVFKAALPSGMKAEEKYKPKTELCLTLAEQFRNERALHLAMDMLRRADKQMQAFTCFLQLSHWDTMKGTVCGQPPIDITREELMNVSHANLSAVNMLVKRGMLVAFEREVGRLNRNDEPHSERICKLSNAQAEAYNGILFSFLNKNVTLLHGVTSSGKTEIYIHLIQQELDKGRQVLYLLPEIALTVQIMERLRRIFGSRLGIYHSKYSDAERVEMWHKQLSDAPFDVILGVRSAVLLPFQRLGLIIIDEEHETSYKQQDPAPRYHARSAAIMLAAIHGGVKTLLGTATPSMETLYNAKTGKFGLVELKTRFKGVELPQITTVDIKDLRHRKMMRGPFSPLLLARIREAIENGEQAILFQNRRGFAPMMECKQCGWVPRCVNCDVSLTLHRNMNQLTCHYCGHTYNVPAECPACGEKHLFTRGFGTEKIEDTLREIFPEARIARMDLDTTRTRSAYERIIGDFADGRTDILIGTQMVSKGLDFDRVSVVGILDADSMLNYPDFRAYEHAFMMMAQVSGRAGRRGKQGLVILQTSNPDLPVIKQVTTNDSISLYNDIKEERKLFHYPPYTHLIYIYMRHSHDNTVNTAALELGSRLRQWFGERVLGPDKPSVARVKAMHIRKIVLKLETGIDLKRVREYLRMAQNRMMEDRKYAALQIYYDVDPI
ncbi:MAG: primosomal protein N' [Prevotella sp.]